MKVLVTGKNGQLGSEIRSIRNEFDHFDFTFTDSQELDISSKTVVEDFFNQNKFDAVINCAAYTAVDLAEEEQEKAKNVNHLGVKYLVDACEKYNCMLIHISTDYVFDGTNNIPYKESDSISPIGVYGKTKQLGEQVILESSLNAIIIRTSWVYSTIGNNFVKTMIRLGSEHDELGVIVDQVGTPTNAKDLAHVCLTALSNHKLWEDRPEIFHYSNEGVTSWFDFATAIMELANLNCNVKPIETSEYPTKTERPHYSVLNKKKITSRFNIHIPHWRASLITMFSEN